MAPAARGPATKDLTTMKLASNQTEYYGCRVIKGTKAERIIQRILKGEPKELIMKAENCSEKQWQEQRKRLEIGGAPLKPLRKPSLI